MPTPAIAVAIASVACGEDEKETLPSQAETDRKYLNDRLAAVCDGRAYPNAKRYESTPGDHKIAVMQSFATGEGTWYAIEHEDEPTSIQEAELVACAEREAGNLHVEVAVYRVHDGAKIGQLPKMKVGSGGDRDKKKRIVAAVAGYAEGKPPASAALPPPPAPSTNSDAP